MAITQTRPGPLLLLHAVENRVVPGIAAQSRQSRKVARAIDVGMVNGNTSIGFVAAGIGSRVFETVTVQRHA